MKISHRTTFSKQLHFTTERTGKRRTEIHHAFFISFADNCVLIRFLIHSLPSVLHRATAFQGSEQALAKAPVHAPPVGNSYPGGVLHPCTDSGTRLLKTKGSRL